MFECVTVFVSSYGRRCEREQACNTCCVGVRSAYDTACQIANAIDVSLRWPKRTHFHSYSEHEVALGDGYHGNKLNCCVA